VGEDNIVEHFGDIEISFEGFSGGISSKVDNNDLSFFSEGFDIFLGGFFGRSRGDLLFDPRDNGRFGSSSGIFRGFSVNEPFEGGESLNSKSGSKLFVFSGIDSGESDFRVLILKGGGGFFVFRGK
jgi:hypothetical protein